MRSSNDENILLEGAHGSLLDLDHGTYPLRDELVLHRGRPVPGRRHSASRRSPTRSASSKPTPPASAAVRCPPSCWTRREITCASTPTSSARRPAGPPLRLVRRRVFPLQRRAQRLRQHRRDPPRHPGRDAQHQALRGLRDRRRAAGLPASRPGHAGSLPARVRGVPGWQTSICDIDEFDALPQNAIRFVRRIEELVGAPAGHHRRGACAIADDQPKITLESVR